MSKESISATIEKTTANTVREIAEKDKRSFSQMVDLLLQTAIQSLKAPNKKTVK